MDSSVQFLSDRSAVSRAQPRGESSYLSLARRPSLPSPRETPGPAPKRYSETGRALPSNRSPDPKASIPFRNPDLGLPSQRRASESRAQGLNSTGRTPPAEPAGPAHRRACDSQGPAPRPVSPSPFRQAESLGLCQRRYHDSPTPKAHSTYRQSEFDGPSHRRNFDAQSRAPGPQSPSPFKQAEPLISSSLRRGFDSLSSSGRWGEDQRGRSQGSYGKNLDSSSGTSRKILKSAPDPKAPTVSPIAHLKSSLRKSEPTSRPSHSASSARQSYEPPHPSFLRKATNKEARPEASPSPQWRSSSLSAREPEPTGSSSSPWDSRALRRTPSSDSLRPRTSSMRAGPASEHTSRSAASGRGRGLEPRSPSPGRRSPSPLRGAGGRLSSSQSSLESESSAISSGSGFARRGEYAQIADIPRAKRIAQPDVEGGRGARDRAHSPGREDVGRLFGYERRRSPMVDMFREWESSGEFASRAWRGGEGGALSRAQSTSSLYTPAWQSPER
ncbi:serine/arginine repetitive matrix protein 1 [Lepisosteus oculatus]|uniref:serine/arginine repetitive matrix protein 1 n=1 Tax=Lepisosteus oculatus TaxID=7918 RepID=UPI0035F51F8B